MISESRLAVLCYLVSTHLTVPPSPFAFALVRSYPPFFTSPKNTGRGLVLVPADRGGCAERRVIAAEKRTIDMNEPKAKHGTEENSKSEKRRQPVLSTCPIYAPHKLTRYMHSRVYHTSGTLRYRSYSDRR